MQQAGIRPRIRMSFVTRKVLISNTVFVGVGAIVSDLITLFILPRFVTNLGADLYGLWIISKIILGYFNLLDFGFTEGLTRYVADARVKEQYDRLSGSVMSGLGLLVALGLLIGLVVIGFRADIVDFFEIDEPRQEVAQGLLLVTGLFSIVLWPQRITRVILRACLRMSEQSLLDTATALASSVVLLVLVTQSVNIVTLAVIDGCLRVLLWIPSLVLAIRYVPQIRWRWRLFSLARIREMSSFSLGMFYSAFLTMLTVRLSNLVIAKMISVTAVTSYASGVETVRISRAGDAGRVRHGNPGGIQPHRGRRQGPSFPAGVSGREVPRHDERCGGVPVHRDRAILHPRVDGT